MNPGSTVWQSLEQPSPPAVLPSSQALLVVKAPLPQMPTYSHGLPGSTQRQLPSV
jgi:hypothetical protein